MNDLRDALSETTQRIEALLGQLLAAGDPAERRWPQRELVESLSQFAAADEEVLLPELRERSDLPTTTQRVHEQQALEELTERLAATDFRDDTITVIAEDVADILQHHVDALTADLDTVATRDLTSRFRTVRDHSPTRPHPRDPKGRRAGAAAHVAERAVDRALDAVRDAVSRVHPASGRRGRPTGR